MGQNKENDMESDEKRRERSGLFFVIATSQSPVLPETLATAYNPGMCLLALPVIT